MVFLAIFALLGLFGTEAQKLSIGKCDSAVQPMTDFVLESYLGLWYEIERTNNVFELGGDCVTAQYTFNASTGLVDVANTQVKNKASSTIKGTATLEKEGTGALIVTFPSTIITPKTSNYNILVTDYTSYSLVYYCLNVGAIRTIILYKLGRTTSFTEEVNTYLDGLINNISGVSSTDLRATSFSADACYVKA